MEGIDLSFPSYAQHESSSTGMEWKDVHTAKL